MSHLYASPLAAYNSLTDKHLTGYFNNTRIRRHLQRVGLVTRSGRIVSEKEYRLNAMRKDHQKYIRECLAQAIFHKVLDMERHHQIEIKRKLEHFARMERVQKIKVERSKRVEEDALPLFSPRPPTGPRSSFGRHTLPNGDRSDSSESPSSSRPNSAPGNMQRPARLDPLPNSTGVALTTTPKTALATQPKITAAELDQHCATGVDKELMKFLNALAQPTGISPYRLPVINNFVMPVPPPKKSNRNPNTTRGGAFRGRRFRPTTAPHVLDQLSPKDPVKFHKPSLHSNVAIAMIYLGKSVRLSYDEMDYKDEIKVFQQHCGGENLCIYKGELLEGETFHCTSKRHRGYPFSLTFYINGIQVDRLSSCCEYKHRKGARLGGKHGYFRFENIEGASPCYRCIIAMGLDKKPSPPLKKRKGDLDEEKRKDSNVERAAGTMRSGAESKEGVPRARSTSTTSSTSGAHPETSQDRTEMEEDDEIASVLDESKEDSDDDKDDAAKDDYDEDFEGDDDKADETVNDDEHVDNQQNGRCQSPSDDEQNDTDLKEGEINSSTKGKENSDSERDEHDALSDTEREQLEKQDNRKDSLASSSSTLYDSTSQEESDVDEGLKESECEDARRTSSKATPTRIGDSPGLLNDGEAEDQIQSEDLADDTSPGQEADANDETEDTEAHLNRDHAVSGKDNEEMVEVDLPVGSIHGAERVSKASFEADDDDGDSKSIQEKIAEAIENPKLLNTEPEPSDSSTDEEDNSREPEVQGRTEETAENTFSLEDALDDEDQPEDAKQQLDETMVQEASRDGGSETVVGEAEEPITASEAASENAQPEETTHEVNQEINETDGMAEMEKEETELQIVNEEAAPTEKELTETENSADNLKSETVGTVEESVKEEVATGAEPDTTASEDGILNAAKPVMVNETEEVAIEQVDAVEGETNVRQLVVEEAERVEDESEREAPNEESSVVDEVPDISATKTLEKEEQEDSSPQGQAEEHTSDIVQELQEEMESNKTKENAESQETQTEVGEVVTSGEETEQEKASEEVLTADQAVVENVLPQGEEADGDDASSKKDSAPEDVPEEQTAGIIPNDEVVCEETLKMEDDTTEDIATTKDDDTMENAFEKKEDVEPVAQSFSEEEAVSKEEAASHETSKIKEQETTETVNEVQEETQDTILQGNDADKEDSSKETKDAIEAECEDKEVFADSSTESKEPVQDNGHNRADEKSEDIFQSGETVAETSKQEEIQVEDEGVVEEVNSERKAEVLLVPEGDGEVEQIKVLPAEESPEKETNPEVSSAGDTTSPEATPTENEQSTPEKQNTADIASNGTGQEENKVEAFIDESEESNKEALEGEENIVPGEEEATTEINTNDMKQEEEVTLTPSEDQETALEVKPNEDEGAPEMENALLESQVHNSISGLPSVDVKNLVAAETSDIEKISLVAEEHLEEKTVEETADKTPGTAADEEMPCETAISVEANGENTTMVEEMVNEEENIDSKAEGEDEQEVPESEVSTEKAETDEVLRLEEPTTEVSSESVSETAIADHTAKATETGVEVQPEETEVIPVVKEFITEEASNGEIAKEGSTEPSNQLKQTSSEEATTEESVGSNFGEEGSVDQSKDAVEVLEESQPKSEDTVETKATEEEQTIATTNSSAENMDSGGKISPVKPEEETGEEGSSSNP